MKTTRRRKFTLAGLPPAEIELHRKVARTLRASDSEDLFGEDAPEDLMAPYAIDWDNTKVAHKLQRKYLDRGKNIRRCWNRIQLYLPELLVSEPVRVLEMSTAHGAMLEILRHYGHDVLGNDYVNMVSGELDPKSNARFRQLNDDAFVPNIDDHGIENTEDAQWPYQEIIEAVDIPVKLFDAGQTPYPFEDKAFDVVICMQAIEHYCHPTGWLDVVAEFCRISRQSVVIMLNPMLPNMEAEPGYKDAYNSFRLAMRGYDAHGFRCTSCHVHWGKALIFKLSSA